MADLARIEQLRVKQVLGESTGVEDDELEVFKQESEANRHLLEVLLTIEGFRQRRKVLRGYNPKRLHRRTMQKLSTQPGLEDWETKPGSHRRMFYWGMAASLLVAIGGIWWNTRLPSSHSNSSVQPSSATFSWQTQRGAGDREESSGSFIALDEMVEGEIYLAGDIRIAKVKGEYFLYHIPDAGLASTKTTNYSLEVKGEGEVKLIRYDAISALIKGNSSVSFDLASSEAVPPERTVACTGQVFFDVDPNPKSPVIVRTDKQEVSVLGTVFQVRDYEAEDTGAVFCYKGEVRVKEGNRKAQSLFASQRATVRPNQGVQVSTGDFPMVEWSSPELLFDFSEMNLDSAMTKIAQWYKMSYVDFGPGIDRKTRGTVLIGKVSRYLTLQQLLSILERSDLHFKIQGQTILVTK